MTDAQIALYAALRVAVPVEWRISMDAFEGIQHAFLTRLIYAEPGPLAPRLARFFRLPNRQVVGMEKLGIAAPLEAIENHAQARRYFVLEAEDQIREYERAADA